jgi:flagellar hook protein FlgE
MIGSLFAGMVGLNVNSTSMTVLGDNIANVRKHKQPHGFGHQRQRVFRASG